MYEYKHFDGYDYTTFDIIAADLDRRLITVAVTYIGKISVITYDLYEDRNGLYFEYGPLFTKIHTDDFIYRSCENDD